MDKVKKFFDCYIPTETCNLRCHYCYIAQQHRFGNRLAKFSHSKEETRKAFAKDRLGGPCLFNLCAGGETLLSAEVLPLVRELLKEGHYVMVVTNGTMTKRFQEAAAWPEELRHRLMFKISFHYLEMRRLNMMDTFFSNVDIVKKSGISFTVEITPSDELMPYIEDVKNECMERLGALCHITVGRNDCTDGIDVLTNLSFDEYKKVWSQFNSELFSFKMDLYHKKCNRNFCYAGLWSAYINLDNGDMRQCYSGKILDNIYSDTSRPLHFEAVGYDCTMPYCFNGHAFVTLGDVPSWDAPTYAEVRNRVCEDGSEWLSPEMKAFLGSKLEESNPEYSSAYRALRKAKKVAGDYSGRAVRKLKHVIR